MKVYLRRTNMRDYKMFEHGKLNTNFPEGFNLLLGSVERDYTRKDNTKVDYHIEIIQAR